MLPLRPDGRGEPLFAVHPGNGLAWSYSALADRLDTDRPIMGLQMGGISPEAPAEGETAAETPAAGATADGATPDGATPAADFEPVEALAGTICVAAFHDVAKIDADAVL